MGMIEQSLDGAGDSWKEGHLTGKIDGWISELFRHADVEQSVSRFETAVDEQWSLVRAVATSGAHGWQIVGDDDGSPSHLEEGAYPEDVTGLVFENGWIYRQPGEWVKDPETVERVREAVDRRTKAEERRHESEQDVFDGDDRLRQDQDVTGNPMDGRWVFDSEGVEFAGRPDATAAFRDGWDARDRLEGGGLDE